MSASEAGSRQRRRVPVSCLNCRRRKVKCDKQKPVCGGCVRNGVAHLCEYLDPHWTSGQQTVADVSGAEDRSLASERYVEELRQIKVSNERTIHNQRKEIEDLRRQLSFNNQLSTDHLPDKNANTRPVIILTKLNPLLINNKEPFEIESVPHLSVKKRLTNNKQMSYKLELYSWISVIRLDPKLSNLWNKINNMQRIYHMYKKSKQSRIQAVDFTSSKPNSPHNEAPRCPVVSCDMNFMQEDSPIFLDRESEDKSQPTTCESPLSIDEEIVMDFSSFGGLKFGKTIQNLWSNFLQSPRGSKTMKSPQLTFLLDYYFNAKDVISSRHLTSIFKDELYALFVVQEDDEISLSFYQDFDEYPETIRGHLFVVKSLVLILLVLIVDETLEILRSNVKNGVYNERMMKYQMLFPEEIIMSHIPGKGYQRLQAMADLTTLCFNLKDNKGVVNKSLIGTTVLIMSEKALARHTRDNLEFSDSFRLKGFKLLLSIVLDQENGMDIWKNPLYVALPENESKKKIKDLRIHLCFLWAEVVRFVNAFSFGSLKTHSVDPDLDDLVRRAYSRIEEVQLHENHIKYIQGLKTTEYDTLVTSLSINYLIANVHISLTRGASHLFGAKLTIKDLDGLIGECGSWLEDERLSRLPTFLQAELKILLHVCNIYVTYIMFLQCEEGKLESLKENLIVAIFIKIDALFKDSQSVLDKSYPESYYLYNSLSEIFTLVIQILVAILLRTCQRPNEKNEMLLKQLSSFYYSMSKSILESEKDMKDMVRSQLSKAVTSTLERLHELILPRKLHTSKLLKLWDFYLKVLDSAKTYDFNYNKLHANVPGFSKLLNSDAGDDTGEVSFGKCPVAPEALGRGQAPGKCPFHGSESSNGKKRTSVQASLSEPDSNLQQAAKNHKSAYQIPLQEQNSNVITTAGISEPFMNSVPDIGMFNPDMEFSPNMVNFSNLDLNFLNGFTSLETFDSNMDNMGFPHMNIEDAFQ